MTVININNISGIASVNAQSNSLELFDNTGASLLDLNANLATFPADISVGGGAIVGGALTVTGVLTYDDVTNIDSVGIITARSGVHVTGVGASVGIGTDSPTEKLDVRGDISITGAIVNHTRGTTGEPRIFINNNATANDTNGDVIISGYYPTIFKTNNSQERMRIDRNGNIGIGTDDPQQFVHIHNAGTSGIVTTRIQQESSNTSTDGGSLLELGGTRSDGTFGHYGGIFGGRRNQASDNTGYLAFHVDNNDGASMSERVRITHQGNLGINISTPSQKLHVNGAGMFEQGVRGPMQYDSSYTANSNLDITGFGYGNYIVSVRSGGVYHWNGVLMVTMYDTADFGVQTLVSGNYSTTLTASMVNLSPGNGTLRLVFNRDIGDVRVSVIQIG